MARSSLFQIIARATFAGAVTLLSHGLIVRANVDELGPPSHQIGSAVIPGVLAILGAWVCKSLSASLKAVLLFNLIALLAIWLTSGSSGEAFAWFLKTGAPVLIGILAATLALPSVGSSASKAEDS